MTEKRFTVGFDIGEDYPFYMLKDGENILFQSTSKIEVEEVCDLLNEQHETIQSLKLELELSKPLFSRRQLEAKVKEQEETIEQLKWELKNLRRLANELYMEGSE